MLRLRMAVVLLCVLSATRQPDAGIGKTQSPPPATTRTIDLAQGLADRLFRIVNREATVLEDRKGIRISAKAGVGLVWIANSDFGTGAVEVEVRGKDLFRAPSGC